MLRIVGIQKSASVREEFVLLQNHGNMRVCLRGHVLLGEAYLEQRAPSALHAFADDEFIPPSGYCVVYTAPGIARWSRSKDGSLIYNTYIGSLDSIWHFAGGTVHMLSPQHSYEDRAIAYADEVSLI